MMQSRQTAHATLNVKASTGLGEIDNALMECTQT